MEREEAYLLMLDATAKIQAHIADILEAKALEAEKSRAWICGHIHKEVVADHAEKLKKSLEFHEQLIEVMEGLTKMENGLSQNLSVLLNRTGDHGEGGIGGLGDMFGLGGLST